MQSNKKILFVYNQWQSFVREDYDILIDQFSVKKLHFRLEKSWNKFFFYQLQGIWQLLKSVPKSDLVYIWFNDYHAFWSVLIAKIFRKKTVVIVGGFDAVSIPAIEYGIFYPNNFRTKLARWVYKNCTQIITVDESLILGENTYAGYDAISGLAHFVPKAKEKSIAIPTGYDAEKWKPDEKKQQVLTIALIKDEKVYLRKGIDVLLEVASQLTEYPFIIIGLQNQELIPNHLRNLPNVKILPIVPQEELKNYYAESKVYCQFSMSEGLPNVLCEAMMSGCIPVGSNVNGIPKAIGDTGFVLNEKNPELATILVKKALNDSTDLGKLARNRMIELFPKGLRKEKLYKVLSELITPTLL